MLPTSSKGRTPSRANPIPQYLRRIVKISVLLGFWLASCHCESIRDNWQQMDVEYTFWQMLHLCTSPKVVYQHTKYHKQTKNQWARDDPAFIVICILLLAVSAVAYSAADMHPFSISGSNCRNILLVSDKYLSSGRNLEQSCGRTTLYAFDVHCNSFFPLFVVLYVIHFFISPLLVAHGFIPLLLSNLIFTVAMSYYHYLNFLGYDVILSGFNPSRYFMNIYYSQHS
ncbi:hypothetical protein OSB04_006433 [Centaurea solstitialis]|uniref:UNC-50 family protein n=1 Tax=Centaurea solstitialis TaxID=347529 RepID=A0AA38TQH9_9ASTR|nr:hypothetical protein OSB04_006433 [Centaurea solstitialis]